MGKTILLAEQDANLCKMVVSLLGARGHTIETISSGRAALERVRQKGLDLVIVGENLDDIDGIGWIVKLRQLEPALKAVYISSTWKEAELYQMLTKEFKVALVVHRPLKQTLFPVQIESLFSQALPAGDGAPGGLEATLAALRDKYLQALPERIRVLGETADRARAGQDQPLMVEARRLAHNIKGTAASNGFDRVSAVAARVEASLRDIESGQALAAEDEWDMIESALAVMAGEADRYRQDAGAPAERRSDAPTLASAARARVLVLSTEPLPESPNGFAQALPVEITLAAGTDQALEQARLAAMDAAVIDITASAPHTAFQMARDLRGLSGYENLPLGFILAGNQPEERIEAMHAGASVYLVKPLEGKSFHQALQYLIGVREGGRPRILVVDDDEDFAALIALALGNEGMLVRTIYDPSAVEATMEVFLPDVILLDVNMPGVSGYDVCRMLKATSRWQDIPVIFLTAETGLDARITSFAAGGDDYLPKPVANIELLTRVKARLERARLLKERTDRDVLTGLLLRQDLLEQVNALFSEAERHSLKFCLSILDVDHFKKVNDTYGHFAGDRVLSYFGQLLKKRFRVEDIRGRWGGEEFMLAFRHESKETMSRALSRVLEELKVTPFQGDRGETFYTSFSAGMVSYPEDGATITELLNIADRRLYKAKETGRKQVVFTD